MITFIMSFLSHLVLVPILYAQVKLWQVLMYFPSGTCMYLRNFICNLCNFSRMHRNQTGIKHWKLSTKGGKFFWGHSPLYPSIHAFVEVIVTLIAENKLLCIMLLCYHHVHVVTLLSNPHWTTV